MSEYILSVQDERLRQVLLTGERPDEQGRWVAQDVVNDMVRFSNVSTSKTSSVKAWLVSIRAISLTATLMPAVACLLWLSFLGLEIDYISSVLAIVGLLLLQIAVNLLNDVGDYLKLIDLPNTPGGSGVIQQGWLTARQFQYAAWGALLVGCLCGLPALMKAPEGILFCGLLGVIGVLGYSGSPLNLKYRAQGDVSVFLLCGPVLTMGISYAATGQLHEGVLLLGGYFGFAAAAILNANNMSDIRTDETRGAKTLASILGFEWARHGQTLYYVLAFSCLLGLFQSLTWWVFLPFLLLPLLIKQLKTFYGASQSWDEQLTILRFEAAKLHLVLGVALSISLLAANALLVH